jgi:DNA repair exonuclease SbcCD ATPase subunit
LLAAGIALVVTSMFTTAILFVIGIAALISSIFVIRSYEAMSKSAVTNLSDLDPSLHHKDTEIHVQPSNRTVVEVRRQTGPHSSEQTKSKLSKIFREIKDETGAESMEQLESLIVSLKKEIAKLNSQDLQNKQAEITRKISNLQNEISNLSHEEAYGEPNNVKLAIYDRGQHERYAVLTTNLKKVDETISNSEAVLRQVVEDLKLLKPDCDNFPILDKKIHEAREAMSILDEIEKVLSQICTELIRKGITRIILLMNSLISSLTFQKYSNVEMTDSMALNVYSSASRRYEPFKAFSAGMQDQFLLALKLAFAHLYLTTTARKNSSCPLLLDECILWSDEGKEGFFRLLRTLERTFPQIIIATHDEKLLSYVDHSIVLTQNNHGFTKLESVEI